MENRVIKFRGYSKEEKSMIDDFYMHSTKEIGGGGLFSDKENYILMQFTGLHDKNGVEIYEGDYIHEKVIYGYSDKSGNLIRQFNQA